MATISQVIDATIGNLADWRHITVRGKPYRTHPRNVPPGTQPGEEFRIKWTLGYVWAKLVA